MSAEEASASSLPDVIARRLIDIRDIWIRGALSAHADGMLDVLLAKLQGVEQLAEALELTRREQRLRGRRLTG